MLASPTVLLSKRSCNNPPILVLCLIFWCLCFDAATVELHCALNIISELNWFLHKTHKQHLLRAAPHHCNFHFFRAGGNRQPFSWLHKQRTHSMICSHRHEQTIQTDILSRINLIHLECRRNRLRAAVMPTAARSYSIICFFVLSACCTLLFYAILKCK